MKLDRERTSLLPSHRWFALMASGGVALAASTLNAGIDRLGAEYSVLGPQVGDQVHGKLSLGNNGGYLVWQDNNADESGTGIRAVKFDQNLNPSQGVFRVNDQVEGNQERPAVAYLPNGGAAFAWESAGDIKIRFVGDDGVFVGGEFVANNYTNSQQQDPALAAMPNGNLVAVWSSLGQDGDMQGIYGQQFDQSGKKIGDEFFVNQSVFFNQRTPSVAALNDNRFIVSWISEQFLGLGSRFDPNGRNTDPTSGGERYEVLTLGRVFDATGEGVTDELVLGNPQLINANPTVVAVNDGFMTFYSGRQNVEVQSSMVDANHSWDVYGQLFDGGGNPVGDAIVVNESRFGDQFVPAVSTVGDSLMVTWTGLGQDGDREGVFGRVFNPADNQWSAEFQVNSLTNHSQMLPAVGADANGNAVVVWSGYTGGADSFDLKAQKFNPGHPLPGLEAPFVYGSGFWQIGVSWPALEGIDIAGYALYLDGSETPVKTLNNSYTFTGLNAGSDHTVAIAYLFPDGSRSPISEVGTGSTWGRDENSDRMPDDWQSRYFGLASVDWPGADADADNDGATNYEELLAGTDPTNAESLLATDVVNTQTGLLLRWNAQPGGIYQIQVSTDVDTWFDAGGPRLAVGDTDSVAIVNDQGIAVYRVVRLR